MRGHFPLLHRKQRGFTLLELVFAVMILGFLSLALTPAFRTLMATKDITYAAEQTAINQKIATAMLTYAEYGAFSSGNPTYTLTTPCSSSTNKVFFSIYNPSYCSGTSGLLDALQQQGVSLSQVNNDGKAGKNLRVYQLLAAESQQAYMYQQSGPVVYLNYDFGVIYLTNCGYSQPCNQTAASSSTPPKSQPTLPGDLAATAGAARMLNRGTWVPGTRDIGVTYVSTLPLQKKLLQTTVAQLDRIRTAMTNFYAAQQAANPTSTANFYPQPSNPIYRSPVNPDPASNQGCREGWYNLGQPVLDILSQIGVGPKDEALAGQTAWGAAIEYCRDYDPAGTSPYGVAPHFAALRVNRSLSFNLGPDADPANNAVISF